MEGICFDVYSLTYSIIVTYFFIKNNIIHGSHFEFLKLTGGQTSSNKKMTFILNQSNVKIFNIRLLRRVETYSFLLTLGGGGSETSFN